MKKLLIPILCCLLAAASCTIGGSYSATNMQDFVTLDQGKLVNDNGVVYTLTEIAGKDLPTLEEGRRYYVVFDILNEHLEVRLKHAVTAREITPVPAPDNVEETEIKDPLTFRINAVGPKYWDLGIVYYRDPKNNFTHDINAYYRLEDAGSSLHMYVFHDGNNENPTHMEVKDLIEDAMVVSIPVSAFQGITNYLLTFDVLSQNTSTGEYKIDRRTIESN